MASQNWSMLITELHTDDFRLHIQKLWKLPSHMDQLKILGNQVQEYTHR